MEVPVIDVRENTLVRFGFQCVLEKEFNIYIWADDLEKLELARDCIEIYENEQEFFDQTGWQRDNPESSDFQYLLSEQICRMIDGKVWYFSGIRYADGLKMMMEESGQ